MTIKEYLGQAYLLDQRINSHIEEANSLRDMATSLSSPSLGDKVQSCPDGNAPFVKQVERIIQMEDKINAEIDKLVMLKEQINSVISGVRDPEDYILLRYRYIEGLTWERVAVKMHLSESSVYKKHNAVMKTLQLPANPIFI